MNAGTRPLILCAALSLLFAFGACAGPQAPKEETRAQPTQAPANTLAPANQEAPVAPTQPDANAQPTATPAPTPSSTPQTEEVRAALQRIYKDAVAFDERAARAAVVGDFNGDGSEDIAFAARPSAGKVAELNDDLSNWIVVDPRRVQPPDPRNFNPHEGVQKLAPQAERARVETNDTLLVVIHGYKDAGWRSPEAMQTYLLKNAAGSQMNSQTRAAAQSELKTKTLHLLGDVIHENLGSDSGFIYWTGANYGWIH
jgi:hypothetical protein